MTTAWYLAQVGTALVLKIALELKPGHRSRIRKYSTTAVSDIQGQNLEVTDPNQANTATDNPSLFCNQLTLKMF